VPSIRMLPAVVALSLAVVLAAGGSSAAGSALPAGSGAGARCATVGIAVTPVQSSHMYVDTAIPYLSEYVGYAVKNVSASSPVAKPWVQLENFSNPSALSLASGEPGLVPLGDDGAYSLAGGMADTAFFYLTASAPQTAARRSPPTS
jgi:hypothetical protein